MAASSIVGWANDPGFGARYALRAAQLTCHEPGLYDAFIHCAIAGAKLFGAERVWGT